MSYTALLGILKDGTVETVNEYRNGSGAAPYIWRILFEVRRGLRPYNYPNKGYMDDGAGYLSSQFIPKCTEEEAWMLGLTFDNCIVPRESAPVAAKHLRTLLGGPGQESTHANHWPAILKVLEGMPEKYTGIAIHHTSVSECIMKEGFYDEDDEDEPRPYNINVDKKHFFLTPERIQEWRSTSHPEPENP